MTESEKLLSISSEPLGDLLFDTPSVLKGYPLGSELFQFLSSKNGFYCFEQALHVFPSKSDVTGTMTLEDWNSETLWRTAYDGLTSGLLFFAEDIFGDQFCLSREAIGVFRFHSESAELDFLTDSIRNWAELLLSNYEIETGWTIAHKWQMQNGQLEFGQRLQPKIPFVYGGEYTMENLWAGDAVKGMLFKGDLALKIKDLPDGTQVRLHVKEPE